MTRQSDVGAILGLLSQAFNDEAINILAMKLFPNVYNDFTVGMNRTQKIRMIVDYANRQGFIPDLLAYVQKKNKHQYNVYALKLENQHSGDSIDLSYPKIPITSNSIQESTFANRTRTLSNETMRGQNDKVEYELGQELDDALGKFHESLLSKDIDGANNAFLEIKRTHKKLTELGSNLVKDRAADYQRVQSLLKLAGGTGDLTTLVRHTAKWADDCMAAYLLAHRKLVDEKPAELRMARLELFELTVKGITNGQLRDELEAIERSESYVQPRVWPYPAPNHSVVLHPSNYVTKVLQGKNPFQYPLGQDDQYTLFGPRGAFWAHPLYKLLNQAKVPYIISGPTGCGQTTLAQGLGLYHGQDTQLSLYLTGQPELGEIKNGFAQLLLDFVMNHPTLLSKMTIPERILLAQVLVATFSKEVVSSEIRNTRLRLKNARWLYQEQTLRKEYWERLAAVQLRLLEEVVTTAESNQQYEIFWPQIIYSCARSLGFSRVLLVLDATSATQEWVKEKILRHIRLWYADQRGLITFLFVRDSVTTQIESIDHFAKSEPLSWTKDQFVSMLYHRYKSFFGKRAALGDRFEENTLDHLVEKCQVNGQYNPQLFVKFWNQITANKVGGKITEHDLQKLNTLAKEKETKSKKEQDSTNVTIHWPEPTIGIITALSHEHAAVAVLLENRKEYAVPRRGSQDSISRYMLGNVQTTNGGRHHIVLSLAADMGNNMAVAQATLLLEDFPTVNAIIMVGIAGGVPHTYKPDEHVRLGDIVVSNRYGVIQYDFDKESITETIHRHPPRPPSPTLLSSVRLLEASEIRGMRPWTRFIELASRLLHAARPNAKTDVLVSSDNPEEVIDHPKDPKRRRGKPRIFLGPIASANKLLKNPLKRDELRDKFGVKAVEMEGSGIADATWNQEVGYLVIRGICDYCDSNKGDDWQKYAAIVAAAYTWALLESIPDIRVIQESKNNEQ